MCMSVSLCVCVCVHVSLFPFLRTITSAVQLSQFHFIMVTLQADRSCVNNNVWLAIDAVGSVARHVK